MNNRVVPLVLAYAVLAVWPLGCGVWRGGPTLTAAFQSAPGLALGAPVALDGQKIGAVKALEQTGGAVKVTMVIDADALARIQSNAAAMIADNDLPGETAAKQVKVFNPAASAPPIQAGQSLTALGGPLEYMAWQAQDALSGSNDFGKLARDFINEAARRVEAYMASDDYKQLQQQVNEALVALGTHSQELMAQARQRLAQSLEEMRPQLEQFQREGKDAAAKALEAYAQELRKLLEQLNEAMRTPSPTAISM